MARPLIHLAPRNNAHHSNMSLQGSDLLAGK